MVANTGFGEDGVGLNGCQAGVGSWVTLSLLPSHWQQHGLPLHFLQSILIDSGCWATNSGEPHRRLRHGFSSSSSSESSLPASSSSLGLLPPQDALSHPIGKLCKERVKPLLMQQGKEEGCPLLCGMAEAPSSSPHPGKPTQTQQEQGEAVGRCCSLLKTKDGLTLWFSRQRCH